jgi:hypothetical protein
MQTKTVTNTKEKEQTVNGSVSIKLNPANGTSGGSGPSEPSGNTKGNAGSGKTNVSVIR